MPLYQSFTDGTRTIVSEVGETSIAHFATQGMRPSSMAQEFPSWVEAKAALLGAESLSELQLKMAAVGPTAAVDIVRREFDLWAGVERLISRGGA